MMAQSKEAGQPPALASQVLMLGMGGEIFALEASMVREILDPVPTTRVADARNFVPALINVRGNIIPLADLRVRFGMPRRHDTADTRIVVVEIALDGDPVVVGLLADKVYEVVELPASTTQQPPRLGMRWRSEFIRSIASWNDQFVIIPDLKMLLL